MAAVNSILQVENLTKSFGDLVLFENISFGLSEGQRVGLIAKNGSGMQFLADSAHADACAPGNPKDASVEDLKDLFRKIMA